MILIYLEDKGKIFYTQERDGIYGQKFNLIKLRTMKKMPKREEPNGRSKMIKNYKNRIYIKENKN